MGTPHCRSCPQLAPLYSQLCSCSAQVAAVVHRARQPSRPQLRPLTTRKKSTTQTKMPHKSWVLVPCPVPESAHASAPSSIRACLCMDRASVLAVSTIAVFQMRTIRCAEKAALSSARANPTRVRSRGEPLRQSVRHQAGVLEIISGLRSPPIFLAAPAERLPHNGPPQLRSHALELRQGQLTSAKEAEHGGPSSQTRFELPWIRGFARKATDGQNPRLHRI